MKYFLNVRTRPELNGKPQVFIDQVVQRLRQLGPPWGLKAGQELPSSRGGKNDPLITLKLTKHLGDNVKGELTLQNRNWIAALPNQDQASCDDFIHLDFNPLKVPYRQLSLEAFPAYVEAMGAYSGTIEDDQLSIDDFDRWRESGNTGRNGVFRIQPVSYWDAELCRRGFGLTPDQVVQRVATQVESAKVFNGGALIVVTSKVLSKDEIAAIDGRIRPLLTSSGT